MTHLIYISHANVIEETQKPISTWALSDEGRERHLAFGKTSLAHSVTKIMSSVETKAIEAARYMFPDLQDEIDIRDHMHEVDSSSTGFQSPEDYEDIISQFFSNPVMSVRGWERAVNAQSRIVKAIRGILAEAAPNDVIAISGHGIVGTLLYCHFSKNGISRAHNQPGNSGGNVLIMDADAPNSISSWKPMESFG